MSNNLEHALVGWRIRQKQLNFWCPSRKEYVLKHPKNSRYRSLIDPEPNWSNTPEDIVKEEHQFGEIDVDSHYKRVNYFKRLERRDNVIRANEARIEAAMAEQVKYEEKEAYRLKTNYPHMSRPFYIRESIWEYEQSTYIPRDEFGRELRKRRRLRRPTLDGRIAYTEGGYRATGVTPREAKEKTDDIDLEESLKQLIASENDFLENDDGLEETLEELLADEELENALALYEDER